MDSKTFLQQLRKMIREEVTLAVKQALNESTTSAKINPNQVLEHAKQVQRETQPVVKKTPLSDKPSLMELLNETKESMEEESRTMSFTSRDAQTFRGVNPAMLGYGDMAGFRQSAPAIPTVDIDGRPVVEVDPVVEKALTRDYSAVMKALADKKKQKMASKTQIPVGLKLPLQRGSMGFFNQNFNTLDQAYSNIKNLLLTMTGERRMNVNFGSPLNRLVFEPITSEEEIMNTMAIRIQELLNLYFPYIDILAIGVDFPDYNPNRIDISLKFRLKNSSNNMFGVETQKTLSLSLNTNN